MRKKPITVSFPNERKFQQWFVDKLVKRGIWAENIHPSLGMSPGIPDIVTLSTFGQKIQPMNVFCELKTGYMQGDRLVVSDIRPQQRRWNFNYTSHGGLCCFIAGIEYGDSWKPAILSTEAIMDLQSGLSIGEYSFFDPRDYQLIMKHFFNI